MAEQCSLDGCGRPRMARGLCSPHYMRVRMGNDVMTPIRKRNAVRGPCTVEGCDQKCKAKGLCPRHYDQQRPKRKR